MSRVEYLDCVAGLTVVDVTVNGVTESGRMYSFVRLLCSSGTRDWEAGSWGVPFPAYGEVIVTPERIEPCSKTDLEQQITAPDIILRLEVGFGFILALMYLRNAVSLTL